jgi:hypothetical protein
MDASPVTAWFFNWMWSLPLIVVTIVIHVVGLGLINDKIVQPLSGIAQRSRFTASFIVIHRRMAGDGATCNRGIRLGRSIPSPGRRARYERGSSLFVQRHDGLRARQRPAGAALAAHGSIGGAERIDAVRADHRFHVRHDRTRLAGRPARTTPNSIAHVTERRACRCYPLTALPPFGVQQFQISNFEVALDIQLPGFRRVVGERDGASRSRTRRNPWRRIKRSVGGSIRPNGPGLARSDPRPRPAGSH